MCGKSTQQYIHTHAYIPKYNKYIYFACAPNLCRLAMCWATSDFDSLFDFRDKRPMKVIIFQRIYSIFAQERRMNDIRIELAAFVEVFPSINVFKVMLSNFT